MTDKTHRHDLVAVRSPVSSAIHIHRAVPGKHKPGRVAAVNRREGALEPVVLHRAAAEVVFCKYSQ